MIAMQEFSSFLLASIALGAAVSVRSESCPSLPSSLHLHNITKLPDPFAWYPANSKGRVSNLQEWSCRQQEVNTLLQELELGTKPPPPSRSTSSYSKSASGSNATLTINAFEGENITSFNITITYPPSGTGPFPALIGYGGFSIPVPSSLATIVLDNSAIAEQDSSPASRGVGLFYDLYGTDASAGALMAWSWAVSLIIDTLEEKLEANIKIDKIGITGCSRNGKGALVAGAYDSRIALTIPQESGSGGSACWRLSDAEEGAPTLVQTAGEIVTENVWFSTAFETYANRTTLLPFDHHMLAGLVAPRALFAIDNVGYQWLGPWSSWGCMKAAHKIWEAVDEPTNMGFSMAANHSHCIFPDYQQPELFAFIDRFLLDQDANTDIQSDYGNVSFPLQEWVDWSVPRLV